MSRKIFTIIAILLITISALTAQVIYVKANATGSNNGSSWDNAYTTLQAALNIATPNKQIWVAAGTYKPTEKAGNGTDTRDMAFVLPPNVKIYGGFSASGNPIFADRNWEANTTILSGDLDNNGSISVGDAYHVVISAGNVGTACLDGFTVSGGYANTYGVSIIVNECTIDKNLGGGISIYSSSPTLNNLRINSNAAEFGGGISNTQSSAPIINNVIISGNNVTGSGGGIYNAYSSSITLTNVLISGNKSENGGAIYSNASSITLTNVTISGNRATSAGGAIYQYSATAILKNTIIWNNNTAISHTGGTPTYSHCLIENAMPAGDGNIDGTISYPKMFVASVNHSQAPTTSGNYHLVASSPCLNVGNNDYNSTTTDLAGNPRIYNEIIDLGAYECDSMPSLPSIKNIVVTDMIKVYPNPVRNTLNVESSETIEQISIYDISGRTLLQTVSRKQTATTMGHAPLSEQSIDISNFAIGIYLVKIKTATGEIVRKIVIND